METHEQLADQASDAVSNLSAPFGPSSQELLPNAKQQRWCARTQHPFLGDSMLVLSGGKCDKCDSSSLPFTQQEASVTCKRCEAKFTACHSCKSRGCPTCGGKLESQMDWAVKNGIMF